MENFLYSVFVDEHGTKFYKNENDELHRLDGPAIEYTNGQKEWYKNGRLHREDGPAIEWKSGARLWYYEGCLHRLDGPAVEGKDGSEEYWIHGKLFSKPDYDLRIKRLNSPDLLKDKIIVIEGREYKLVTTEKE